MRMLALLLIVGCALPPGADDTLSAWPDAAGGVSSPALASVSVRLWEELLASDPIWAGRLGDARYLARLPDESPAALRDERERLLALQSDAESIDAAGLSPDDRTTLLLAREELGKLLLLNGTGFETWLVDPRRAPHIRFLSVVEDQPADTRAAREALVARWAAMPGAVEAAAANLTRGLQAGRTGNRTSVRRTIEQLDRLLGQPVDDWPLANPVLPPTLPAQERRHLLERVRHTLHAGLLPALVRYRELLQHRILPAARSDEQPGLSSMPGGPELYGQLILVHTGLPLTPEEVHAFGLAEVARIRAEISRLGQALLGTGDVAEIQRRLREDPELHFRTREEVEDKAREALRRATLAMPECFGLLPAAPCIVVRIGEHEERDTTIAYYRGPAADGSLPGRYFINTYAPETRPRYEAEVLAFHEAIPGHHLQVAIAQEREGLPRFRREEGSTAFVEGWALYTERLCDELGLYSGDLDRFGVLSFDAWRACRLVVDTGLHAYGWSRQRAIDYMLANTLLASNNVENEVDRYITTPGQALAYKVGQREILALRSEARAALGERFRLEDFHDRVLENGAVTLTVLRRHVEAWVAQHPAAP
jgi:uncharacterized protein (DUF885 family)